MSEDTRQVRIKSNGTVYGTRVFDAATGNEFKRVVSVCFDVERENEGPEMRCRVVVTNDEGDEQKIDASTVDFTFDGNATVEVETESDDDA